MLRQTIGSRLGNRVAGLLAWLCAGLLAGSAPALASSSPAGPAAAGGTLREQADAAARAFAGGDYVSAHGWFEAMELDYGGTPEYRDEAFRRVILPARGYAALMVGEPEAALAHFAEALEEVEPKRGVRAFVLYNIAVARAATGDAEGAAADYRAFAMAFPDSPEAGLALLREAELLHRAGKSATALERLQAFHASTAPRSLRTQGRLRALQIAGTMERADLAREILLETEWRVTEMPDIAILTFAAVEAGDLLLREGRTEDAIRAYRLALPRERLIVKQRERLEALRAVCTAPGRRVNGIREDYFRRLEARLAAQLERLRGMEDYTPGLHLRAGRAYLLTGRHREAVLLFREVAERGDFAHEVRAQAHYRWILALGEGGRWAAAREVADGFARAHPGHPLGPDARFLVARAHQAEGAHEAAIAVLDALLAAAPDDPRAPRWHFSRGYNACILERYAEARSAFEAGVEGFPNGVLATRLRLWAGLTHFFERDYGGAMERLTALAEKSAGHPLFPEILYRLANVHYARKEYDAALETTGAILREFPDHWRVDAARALAGDARMGLGDLDAAVADFAAVAPEAGPLYDYAVFQTAKIHRATERHDRLRAHLRAYVARDDAAGRPRVAEALHWIAWSLRREERTDEALRLYESALARFGDDPEARGVDALLAGYAELRRRHAGSAAPVGDWLRSRREAAASAVELTRYARLTRFEAGRRRRAGDLAGAEATLLAIHRLVPLDRMDAAGLGAVGRVLAERGYGSARACFERLLTEYPDHFERGAAYYGKALLAARRDRLSEAGRWLRRFLEETPTHAAAAEARLLGADVLTRQGRHDEAEAALNELLRIKTHRGRPHARALAALARLETARERPKRAIGYWQRLYTLYRAYPELLAPAYWESALLFETLDDPAAARDTLREMLADTRLEADPLYARARARLPELEAAARAAGEFAGGGPPEGGAAP